MFQSKGRWVGYLPGVGKKAFATKEEEETSKEEETSSNE